MYSTDGPSKDNLHFDGQSKELVSPFSVALFSKRNRKHVFRVEIETLVKV